MKNLDARYRSRIASRMALTARPAWTPALQRIQFLQPLNNLVLQGTSSSLAKQVFREIVEMQLLLPQNGAVQIQTLVAFRLQCGISGSGLSPALSK